MKLSRITKRLVIRPLEKSDYLIWKAARLTPKKKKNRWDSRKRQPHEVSRGEFNKLLTGQEDRRKKDYYYDFGIIHKATGELIGGISIMEVSRFISQTAYLGYWIESSHWGHGYGKEAVVAVFEIAFYDLKLHRIEAGIEPQNYRSIALARSLGMRLEGKKKRCLYLREKWVDLLIYTLTCEDLNIPYQGKLPRIKPRS